MMNRPPAHATDTHPRRAAATAANRLGLDYAAEAARMGPPPAAIVDVHTHVGGAQATAIYARAAALYGVRLTYSMTPLEEIDAVRDVLGDRIRFIAVPNFRDQENRRHHLGPGYAARIERYHALGARIAKFWAAPRAVDYGRALGDPDFLRLDRPDRIAAMRVASDLGMIFMAHVADPDTWFRTKYADAAVYGTKREQYAPLERLLDRFTQPWIAAHMGGWPEDLKFLAGLLDRHPNLFLDTSAAKWMVRELSRHPRDELIDFLQRFTGRILFGSDIVTADEHLRPGDGSHEIHARASSADEAFDLYAGRYWALRTLFETDYAGESPIADPDLALVDPRRFTEMDAPPLAGKRLPRAILRNVYHDAARALLDPLYG
jgi:hypothetical protein